MPSPTKAYPHSLSSEISRSVLRGVVIECLSVSSVQVRSGLVAASDDGETVMTLGVNYTMNMPADLDTGVEASGTWYYIWMIVDLAGVITFKFSISSTSPTIPGSSKKRLVGSVYNNGSSNFLSFMQKGNEVSLNQPLIVLPPAPYPPGPMPVPVYAPVMTTSVRLFLWGNTGPGGIPGDVSILVGPNPGTLVKGLLISAAAVPPFNFSNEVSVVADSGAVFMFNTALAPGPIFSIEQNGYFIEL